MGAGVAAAVPARAWWVMVTRRLRARASESFGTVGWLSPLAAMVFGHVHSGSALRRAPATAWARRTDRA